MLLTDEEVSKSKEYGETLYKMLRIFRKLTTKRIFDAALRNTLRRLDAHDARKAVRNAKPHNSVLFTTNAAGQVHVTTSGHDVP